MQGSAPFRVVIAGAGVAGLEALLALQALAGTRVDVTVLEPRTTFRIRALGPGEAFGAGAVPSVALGPVAASAGAHLVHDALAEIDQGGHSVLTAEGMRLGYDALLVAVGARPVPMVAHALTWWPEGDHADFAAMLDELERGTIRRVAFVVPPRPAWALPAYELALLTARRVQERGGARPELTVVTPEAAPLDLFGAAAAGVVADELAAAGVRLWPRAIAIVRDDERLVVHTHPEPRTLDVDRVITLPRAFGPGIAGLRANIEGFVVTDDRGRARGARDVWAAGDATIRLPKSGCLAALQAETAAADIAALAGADAEPRRYRPLLRAELLTGRGSIHLERDLADPGDEGRAGRVPPSTLGEGKLAAPRLRARLAELDGGHRVAPVGA